MDQYDDKTIRCPRVGVDRIFTPPKPKIESLLNLVEKAKKVKQEDD